MSARSNREMFPTHLVFLVLLFLMLIWKYYLYFASPVTGTGLTAGRIGATLGHMLIWTMSYLICHKGGSSTMLLVIGILTVLFGVLTVPMLGYIGVVILYLVYRARRRAIAEGRIDAGEGVSDAHDWDLGRDRVPRARRAGPSTGGHIGSSPVSSADWSRNETDT